MIAQGLCAFQPETVAIQAGRVMLERIHRLATEKVNFAFETTLASRTFAAWIPRLINEPLIQNKEIWQQLSENYDER